MILFKVCCVAANAPIVAVFAAISADQYARPPASGALPNI